MADTGTQLTHDEIDAVVEAITADDLIEAMAAKGEAGGGILMLKVAFNRAAERIGYSDATTLVRAADFKYLADKLGGVVNVESPLSEGTESLLSSAATGE